MFSKLSQLWRRLLFYLRRDQFDRELEEEIQFHLEMKAEEKVEAGISPEEARYAARRQFGNQTLLREVSREMWSFRLLETIARDLRYALRMMVKNPGFTTMIVLTLMLGIGACTAVFSVVYAVMLRPLPYSSPDRLCVLWKSVPKKGLERDWTSYPAFRDWKDQNHVFEDLALFLRPETTQVALKNGDHTEQIQAAVVSANFFTVMGIAPVIGRIFAPKDSELDLDVAVLSYGFWQSRFGGSPDVIGKTLSFGDRTAQIIGVAPEKCQFPYKNAQLWLLTTADPRWDKGFQIYRVVDAFSAVGRLKPHVSIAEAQADMNVVESNQARLYPEYNTDLGISVIPLEIYLTGVNLRRALWLLLDAVTLVLLISCANVASLLLARGFARQGEYAIRSALGAGRMTLLRQLGAEAVSLFLIGGALGVAMAAAIIRVLRALAPANTPRLEEARINSEVLVFALALSVITSMIFGIAPAWKILRNDPQEFLKQGGRTDAGPGRRRIRESLVSLECALLVILLAATGLLLRSFLKLQDANLGFRPDHLLSVRIDLPYQQYGSGDSSLLFFREAIERIEALPGVESAAIGRAIIGDHIPNYNVLVEGHMGARQESVAVVGDTVSDNYFQTIGIPLLRGRNFSDHDPPGAAIINEKMARRLWPGEDPIGKRFGRSLQGLPIALDMTVIGVVGDTRQNGRESDVVLVAYTSARRLAWYHDRRLVARTTTDPTTLEAPIRDVIRSLDKTTLKYEITPVEDSLYNLDSRRRFQLQTLSSFSMIALILAAVGIYSVLSYSVEQRTREIGLKMALGAQPHDVVLSVLAQGMKPVLLGLGIGLIGALAGARIMKSLLYQVSGADPTTFAWIAAVLVIVAFLAAYIPARRAARVDPIIALRWE
ncbi:MAG: ABC transporter permease [Chloracidobacterium sp.]|nr:ABC transporter permease [Chloracidobacterium sp.]